MRYQVRLTDAEREERAKAKAHKNALKKRLKAINRVQGKADKELQLLLVELGRPRLSREKAQLLHEREKVLRAVLKECSAQYWAREWWRVCEVFAEPKLPARNWRPSRS